MYGEENVIIEDCNNILRNNGFSTDEFKITIENGTSYNPNQIVGVQVWITVEKKAIRKKYGLYRTDWPTDFEADLKNGSFN
ncbi:MULTISPECIES: hypothetical protein [Legionella]|uniref:Uncharacterized protein n=1 Tax=Legionella drozanskii LLAP-1 TaxID=1212489 RepID=A0A0W0SVT8_9GAMM|nr:MULTISPECIES: hypothetical protein [Legionella]KTC87456.1 hypothetical protein Ldro_1075 [Legionella drozanskii LLAP-1]PJE06396.1 MAG: hypothetical protein CK430_14960 [Legionella sp.]